MTNPLPLNPQGTVILDGSGNGTVVLRPRNAREVWRVTGASVSVSSNNNEPTFVLYDRDPTLKRSKGGTYSGSMSSDTSLNPFELQNARGDYVTGIWTGGDAGATAILTLTVERRFQ
jgi:hypothetical protein